MSLAHLPTFPLKSLLPSGELRQSCWAWWGSEGEGCSHGTSSLQHRRVWVTSWLRYSSRFARNWRHVRERLCSELRSSSDASCVTILLGAEATARQRGSVRQLTGEWGVRWKGEGTSRGKLYG